MYQIKYSLINSEQSMRHKIKIIIKHKDRVEDESKKFPRLVLEEDPVQNNSVLKCWHWPSRLAQGMLPNPKSKSSDQDQQST